MQKLRTTTDIIDYIDREYSWRRKELSAIRSNIITSKGFAKQTALRAGVALLYAHWEGFIKSSAEAYLNYVAFQKNTYSELQDNFLALSIKKTIDERFIKTQKATCYNETVKMILSMSGEKAKIPYENIIRTGSNLNSEIFKEIMATIGLDPSSYECNYNLIDEVLLKTRNEIAHGEYLEQESMDQDRFDELYEKVTDMICQFENQIQNAVVQKAFRKVI